MCGLAAHEETLLGLSAAATHLAEEFTGRFYRERKSLPGLCLSTDGTLLSCIGNDYGFDEIFARRVYFLGMPGYEMIVQSVSPAAMCIKDCHQIMLHSLCEHIEATLLGIDSKEMTR